jgi:hypothetical protein
MIPDGLLSATQAQLARLVEDAHVCVGHFTNPDGWMPIRGEQHEAIAAAARELVEGEDLRKQSVLLAAITTLYPRPEPEWWQTPLGTAMSRVLAQAHRRDSAQRVSWLEAEAMVGVARRMIAVWAKRGDIESDRTGIVKADVHAVIWRRSYTRKWGS